MWKIALFGLISFMHLIISRDFRKPECSGYGENSKITYLRINMLAERNDRDYCGVFRSQVDSQKIKFKFKHKIFKIIFSREVHLLF